MVNLVDGGGNRCMANYESVMVRRVESLNTPGREQQKHLAV